MRRIKVKLSPSLEQDDITTRLEEALSKEKENTTEVDAELQAPLDNKQGFDQEAAEVIEGEIKEAEAVEQTTLADETAPGVTEEVIETTDEVTDVVNDTESTTVEKVIEVADTETPLEQSILSEDPLAQTPVEETVDAEVPTEELPVAGGEVTDLVAEAVVQTTTGEAQETAVVSFVDKIKASFDIAKSKGFEGQFEDFLNSLTESISTKETEIVSNPLGTTDGSGDLIEPESKASELDEAASSEVVEEVTDSETTEQTDIGVIDETSEVVDSETQAAEVVETTDTTTDEVTEEEGIVDAVEEPTETEQTEDDSTVEETIETSPEASGEVPEQTTDGSVPQNTDTTETVEVEVPMGSEEESAEVTENTVEETTEQSEDTNLNGEPVEDEASEEKPTEEDTTEDGGVEEPEGTDDESLNDYIEGIDEDESELNDTDEMIVEAVDTSSRLGRIAELVKSAIEETKEGDEDDVSGSLAKIAQIATECLIDKVGIEKPASTSVSVESFGDRSSVLYQYEVSLEDIKDTLQKIIEAIMKAIEAAMAWVAEQYRNIQLTVGITERKIKSLRAKLADTSGNPNSKIIENASLVSVLHKGGQMSSTPSKDILQVSKLSSAVYKNLTDWVLDNVEATIVKNMMALKQKQDPEFTFDNQSYNGQDLAPVNDPVKEGFISADEKKLYQIAKGAELPGGKALVLFAPLPDEPDANPIGKMINGDNKNRVLRSGKFGVKLMDYIPNDDVHVGKDLSVLSESEMSDTLDAVEHLLKNLQEYKEVKPKIDKVRGKVKMFALSFKVGSQFEVLPSGDLHSLAAMYSSAVRTIDQPAIAFTNYSLKLISAALQYVNLSMKQYEVESTAGVADDNLATA